MKNPKSFFISFFFTITSVLAGYGQTTNSYPSTGYVGLGTSSPASKLHLSGLERYNLRIYRDGNTANYMSLYYGTGAAVIDPIGTGLLYLGYDQPTNVVIGANNGGNLGIGISPVAQLHLADVYSAGGKNLLVGDDAYINDVDITNTVGVFGNTNNDRGAIKLGSNGPTLFGLNSNLGIGTTNPIHILSLNAYEDQTTLGSNLTSAIRLANGYTNAFGRRSEIQFGLSDASTDILGVIAGEYTTWGSSGGSNGFVGGDLVFGTKQNDSGTMYERMRIKWNGNIGIGTSSPDAKLAVKGQVHANEVKVDLNVPGPDYVFEKDYALPSLDQIKTYIEENKHLPEVPSAKEMEKNGVQLGEMNMLLLKKIEELTLYVIEQNRLILQQSERIAALEGKK